MQKVFEVYNVIPNSALLKKARQEFLSTLKIPVYKILSSTPLVWLPRKEVYDFSERFGNVYHAFSYMPVRWFSLDYVQKFINDGPAMPDNLRAIRYKGEDLYFYSTDSIIKKGKKYEVPTSILINEDLYNLSRIQFKDFIGLTKEDISEYSEYFTVSDKPTSVISASHYEDLARNGLITTEQKEEILKNLELEPHFIKYLRK